MILFWIIIVSVMIIMIISVHALSSDNKNYVEDRKNRIVTSRNMQMNPPSSNRKATLEVIEELGHDFSGDKVLYYRFRDIYYLVVDISNNKFKGYVLYDGMKKEFANFLIDDVNRMVIDKHGTHHSEMDYKVNLSNSVYLEDINLIYQNIKSQNYNLDTLYYDSTEGINYLPPVDSFSDPQLSEDFKEQVEDENYLQSTYISSNLFEVFQNYSAKKIYNHLIDENIYSKKELLIIDKFYDKWIFPELDNLGTLTLAESQIIRDNEFLKETPYNTAPIVDINFSFKNRERGVSIAPSFFKLVKVINTSNLNEHNFDLMLIYMYIKVRINEDIITDLNSTFSLKDMEEFNIEVVLRRVVTSNLYRSEKYLLALALLTASPMSSVFIEYNKLVLKYNDILEDIDLENFKREILSEEENKVDIDEVMNEVDHMDGYQFENFVGEIYKRLGYEVEVTKSSGDQGVDVVIIDSLGNKTGIQTKRNATKVNNRAVQEIYSGMNYYDCSKGIVVTNNFFTTSAILLAEKNEIELVNRLTLYKILDTLHNGSTL